MPGFIPTCAAERMIELGRREPVDELVESTQPSSANYCWRNLLTGHLLCARGRWYLMRCDGRDRTMRFNKLYAEINQGKIDSGWLEKSRRWTTSS